MTDFASVLEDKQDFMDQVDAAQESGADLSSSSVLNVAPTTSVKKAGLYDYKNPAKAATSEGLYAHRKAAAKLAGVTFGTQGYKDWDAKTRALMGVKPGEKFSSGQWMETFGSMNPDQINEEIGNVEYYLNDTLSSASSSSSALSGHAKKGKPRINPYISNFPALVRQRPMGAAQVQVVPSSSEFFGGSPPSSLFAPSKLNPYTDDPTKQGLYEPASTSVPGYFDKLQAAHPSFRVPRLHGGSNQPSDPALSGAFPITDQDTGVTTVYDINGNVIDSSAGGLISQSFGAPTEEIDLTQGNEGLKFGGSATAAPVNPYARRTTYAGLEGEMFGFDEQIVAQPGLFDAETADSFNDWLSTVNPEVAAAMGLSPAKPGDPYVDPRTLRTSGNIDLVKTGISGGTNPATGLPYKPGETIKQSFLPDDVGGQYWGIGSTAQSRTDLIKLAASSGQDILDHEYVHAGMRMVAANAPSWQGKIDFQGQDLFDVLFDKQENQWDHVAMHIGIYATNNGTMPNGFWEHPILKDINDDESLTLKEKEERMVRRGKQLGLRLNKAAGLVLAGPVSQQNPSNWFNISSTPWFTGASM